MSGLTTSLPCSSYFLILRSLLIWQKVKLPVLAKARYSHRCTDLRFLVFDDKLSCSHRDYSQVNIIFQSHISLRTKSLREITDYIQLHWDLEINYNKFNTIVWTSTWQPCWHEQSWWKHGSPTHAPHLMKFKIWLYMATLLDSRIFFTWGYSQIHIFLDHMELGTFGRSNRLRIRIHFHLCWLK